MSNAMTVGEAKTTIAKITDSLNDIPALHEKVEAGFKRLDANGSGTLDQAEARQLVNELNGLMGLPAVTDEAFEGNFKALDADGNGELNVTEMGTGVVGAMNYKISALQHYLDVAEKAGNTKDEDPLCV